MIGRFLCRIGLHDWKLSNGRGCTFGEGPLVIFYTKNCRRCLKHKDAVMVP